MKALTYQGPEDIRYDTVPDPTPHDTQGAIVRVSACGICGSDLHIYRGHGFSDQVGYCVGHEAVGEVVEVGSGVRRYRVGDRVLVPASVGCGSCGPCRKGIVLACEIRPSVYGVGLGLEGSQAEAVAVPHADGNLAPIPDGVSDNAAVLLTDNAPTAWFGARRARIEPGDDVAVIGLGPVGLFAVMAAQLMGAGRVFAIDLVGSRRQQAKSLGAIPIDGEPRESIQELTKGRGVNAAIEAVGADATIDMAIKLCGRLGRVSVVGANQSPKFAFPMKLVQAMGLEFSIGLCSVQYELDALMNLTLAGRLHPETIVTHTFPLSQGPEAYALFNSRTDGVSKVVLDPTR